MKTKLILVRHGETDVNVSNKLHASYDKESLNETGRSQIDKTALELLKYHPCVVFSSDEKRAIESAEIIAYKLGTNLKVVNGLQERNWGIYTGKPFGVVKKVLDTMLIEERYRFVPQNGESWQVFEKRLIKSVNTIMNQNLNKNIIIVTHGGAIRVLMPYLLGVSKEESFKYDPENASITMFDNEEGILSCVTINNTDHLK